VSDTEHAPNTKSRYIEEIKYDNTVMNRHVDYWIK
jgi:hypothetical protein